MGPESNTKLCACRIGRGSSIIKETWSLKKCVCHTGKQLVLNLHARRNQFFGINLPFIDQWIYPRADAAGASDDIFLGAICAEP